MTTRKPAGAKALAIVMALNKPDFRDTPGYWVNPDFLSPALREELVPLLCERHTVQEADEFIAMCGELAQQALENHRNLTFANEQEQLTLVADAAKDLLKAMQRLGGDAIGAIATHEYHPMSGSPNSPVQWPTFARDAVKAAPRGAGLLSCSWDMIESLERTARHAAGYLPAGTRVGPDALTATELTRSVVQAYARRFGKLPPISQDGWFVAFMQRLGEHFDLKTGARPVREAIEHARLTSSD